MAIAITLFNGRTWRTKATALSQAFHHDLAVLRIVQRKANLSMAAGQRRPVVQRQLRLSAS